MAGRAILALLLLGLAAAHADTTGASRSLRQLVDPTEAINPILYSAFPYCNCIRDTVYNNLRLDYVGFVPGTVTATSGPYLAFSLNTVSVPTAPAGTPCVGQTVGKIELNVAQAQLSCFRFAATGLGLTQTSVTRTSAGNGRAIVKITGQAITQSAIAAAGNAYPIIFYIQNFCSVSDILSSGTIQYSIFNVPKDCCATGTTPGSPIQPSASSPPSPPPPSFSPPPPPPPPPPPGNINPSDLSPPPPPGPVPFPYCNCDRAVTSSPWRVGSPSISWNGVSGSISLQLYADASIACIKPFNKLEINTHSMPTMSQYRGSIKGATLGGRRVTVIFEQNRPVIKFTALGVPCSVGAAGVTLSFSITAAPTILCGGTVCQYSAFDNDGTTGTCPVGYFSAAVNGGR